MFSSQNQKNKINLSEYNFEFDLSQRLLLSSLSVFEIEVLREIIHNSLKFSVSELCETLESPLCVIQETLKKLLPFKLFYVQNERIYVSKEFRKYFEVQIERFSENFKPDTDFFQALLHSVPIEVLPNWFCISKSSDDIFQSIIENFFLTPQLFQKYINTLKYEDETTAKVIEMVYSHVDLTVDVETLLNKLSISREDLEKIIIVLELQKVCCLRYTNQGDTWKQTITPFNEWIEYLLYKNSISYKPIENPSEVEMLHSDNFIETIDALIQESIKTPISINEYINSSDSNPSYREQIINKILFLRLAESKDGFLSTIQDIDIWLKKTYHEKCMSIYFSTFNEYKKNIRTEFQDKDIRKIEKALKCIIDKGWIYLDDFMNSLSFSIGRSQQITLQKKNRKWQYAFPEYDVNQKNFIINIIEEHLFQAGMVQLGRCKQKKCILITPFGKTSLGD